MTNLFKQQQSMESRDHSNGVSPKNQRSRGNQSVFCQMITKPLIIAIIMVITTSITYAQDIIVTTKAEKITAKVTEVDIDVIRYKQYDYQDGPTYTIKKSDIASIIYQNGQVMTFEQLREPEKPAYTTLKNENTNIDYQHFKSLSENDRAMYEFLEQNDNESYQVFRRGIKTSRAGTGILIPGIALSVAGVVLIGVAHSEDYYSDRYGPDEELLIPGIVLTAVGEALVITSIPLRASGGAMKSRAKNLYEEKYFKGQTTIKPSLQFNTNPNGIGLCLKF